MSKKQDYIKDPNRLDDDWTNWVPPQVMKEPDYIKDPNLPFEMFLQRMYPENGKNPDLFSNTDDEKTFKENLKKQPEHWHYRQKKVEYRLNSNNFRTYEWEDIKWKEAIVVLGCSNVFGVGVAEDETLTAQLEKLTGRQVVNLGVPAGSNELIMHMAGLLVKKFAVPYGVMINWTTANRMRYFTLDNEFFIGPWSEHQLDKKHRDSMIMHRLFIHRNFNVYNEVMHTHFHSITAEAIFKDRAKYVSTTNYGDIAKYANVDGFFLIDNQARDLLHPGKDIHERMAKFSLKYF